MSTLRKSFQQRLDEHTDTSDVAACWTWGGRVDRDGYGRIGKGELAHRAGYTYFKGDIPEGMEIDHLCRNRACVNPDHLEAVTKRTNTLRSLAIPAINARRTHCIHGHPFDAENTYLRPQGGRACRTCIRATAKRTQARKASA